MGKKNGLTEEEADRELDSIKFEGENYTKKFNTAEELEDDK